MVRPHRVWFAVVILATSAQLARAQSVNRSFDPSRVSAPATAVFESQAAPRSTSRDSLWNGALIGAGAGAAATLALDAVFCEAGFGHCDVPWRGYLILGGIGAAAGAGIDYLIGRQSNQRVRVSPIISRTRQGVAASLLLPGSGSLPAPVRVRQDRPAERRDSVWNGALIGAGIGAGGGFIWARNMCGTNDSECFLISAPVGILGGIGIGAAAGAVADALHK
jgi:hypothetical protein